MFTSVNLHAAAHKSPQLAAAIQAGPREGECARVINQVWGVWSGGPTSRQAQALAVLLLFLLGALGGVSQVALVRGVARKRVLSAARELLFQGVFRWKVCRGGGGNGPQLNY